ncbi:MauE/DoxX family redox-associated membrane protein [Nocardioides cynanchi]|uniref:MauE/DoxX family redox-associated membrane protein n=1 Tax=Nocardioides cynanchi TaxID=2558918 RepID=UPI001247E5A5|nr:MauE/DoxX family redox-associated membrane protein [Nocardioides cynanchi]
MPSAPLVVPPLLLIVILVVSAVAKLRDPGDTGAVFVMLELPRVLLRLKAHRLLPYGELVAAGLLLLLPGTWYLAAATLVLLLFLAYLVVVARALTFPYPLICGCFGELGLGWITRRTLVRNSLLVGIALVTWVDALQHHGPDDGLLRRLEHLGQGWWWLGGVALAVLTTGMVLLEGDPPAALPTDDDEYVPVPVPYGVVDGPDGPGALWGLTATAARLLVFYNPGDEHADDLIARVPSWQEQLGPVVVHLVGATQWSVLSRHRPDLGPLLLGDPDGETRRRLGVTELPGAVLLGTDRYLAGGPVSGLEDIDDLVAAAAEQIQAAASPAP